jgi:hypothetical protein
MHSTVKWNFCSKMAFVAAIRDRTEGTTFMLQRR